MRLTIYNIITIYKFDAFWSNGDVAQINTYDLEKKSQFIMLKINFFYLLV